jgi:RNA polymerase sigma-70 factor, ECF subfamily
LSDPTPHDIATVFDGHFEEVYGYVAYRVAPDFAAAADITQETFLAAAEALARFRGESSTATWLRSLARRKVADHFRRREARGRLEETCRDLAAARAHAADDERAEQALLVGPVMRRLTAEQAELLELKYIDGLPVTEIAARRGATEKAIESALTRAREAFRKVYEEIKESQESASNSPPS